MPTSKRTRRYITTALADLDAAKEVIAALDSTSAGIAHPNMVLAGPTGGARSAAPAPPEFRSLVLADLPELGPQAANLVFAGPTSGTTIQSPTFRPLVAADLPEPAPPAPQAANLVYAGPESGTDGAPLWRKLVTSDLPAPGPVVTLGSNHITFGATAPTTGSWSEGDVCFNSAVTATTNPGWSCITAGTPGTWKAWPALI